MSKTAIDRYVIERYHGVNTLTFHWLMLYLDMIYAICIVNKYLPQGQLSVKKVNVKWIKFVEFDFNVDNITICLHNKTYNY